MLRRSLARAKASSIEEAYRDNRTAGPAVIRQRQPRCHGAAASTVVDSKTGRVEKSRRHAAGWVFGRDDGNLPTAAAVSVAFMHWMALVKLPRRLTRRLSAHWRIEHASRCASPPAVQLIDRWTMVERDCHVTDEELNRAVRTRRPFHRSASYRTRT